MADNLTFPRMNRLDAVPITRMAFERYLDPPAGVPSDMIEARAWGNWIKPENAESPQISPMWSDEHDLAAAAVLLNKIISDRSRSMLLGCTYVVASEGEFCKIGISNDPHGRLAALQTSSPYRLRLGAMVWATVGARVLEQSALKILRGSGTEVRGEWARTDWTTALKAVFAAASDADALMAPAGMMIRSFLAGHRLGSDEDDREKVSAFVAEQFDERSARRSVFDRAPGE